MSIGTASAPKGAGPAATAPPAPLGAGHRPPRRRDLRRMPGFGALAVFCLIFLYAPIVVLVTYSFNDNNSVTIFTAFSLRWYQQAFANEEIRRATLLSLEVAAVATVFATIAATMAALATTRTARGRRQTVAYGIINQPLMVPEIVTAVATLSLFALIRQWTGIQSTGYLIAAHTVFCIPFAYLPIRARLEDMDLTLETAAADLYASPMQVFWTVTLPLLLPGIIAGAMLAFVVSLDDVIITVFVAGPGETTLPVAILGYIRRGITPEINAVSTLLIAVTVVLIAGFFLITRRRA